MRFYAIIFTLLFVFSLLIPVNTMAAEMAKDEETIQQQKKKETRQLKSIKSVDGRKKEVKK